MNSIMFKNGSIVPSLLKKGSVIFMNGLYNRGYGFLEGFMRTEDSETILVLSIYRNPSGVKPVLELIEISSELCIYET